MFAPTGVPFPANVIDRHLEGQPSKDESELVEFVSDETMQGIRPFWIFFDPKQFPQDI